MLVENCDFCRAMRCISAAYVVMRCVSVTFVDCVKTNKDIFEFFSPSSSYTILVFPYQTGWRYSDWNPPLTGASNAGGVGRNRNSEPVCLLLTLQQAWCCKHGRRWTTATVSQVVTISLVVYCGYSTTKRHARWSHCLCGSSARERPSAVSHYTQSR